MTNYIVRNGDTIDSIARNFGVSTIDIINANNLSNYFLTPGMSLVIPSLNETAFIDYTVKQGDTIFMRNNDY